MIAVAVCIQFGNFQCLAAIKSPDIGGICGRLKKRITGKVNQCMRAFLPPAWAYA